MQNINPSLYQVFTRVFLNEIKPKATLEDIPNSFLDTLSKVYKVDFLYLLGIWQTGPNSVQISRKLPNLIHEMKEQLPDLQEDVDITGSPFAVQSYTLHKDFGKIESLTLLKNRLKERNLKLIVDFVPNHSGLDCNWAVEHPEYYVHGTEEQYHNSPQNYIKIKDKTGKENIIAHGRDPYFDGWRDTLQLNYRNQELKNKMTEVLLEIAKYADGVRFYFNFPHKNRCDMAMLLLTEIFNKTWENGITSYNGTTHDDTQFWDSAIKKVKSKFPNFIFIAEVYWDKEWDLQQLGFDYTYDKRMYDRLKHKNVRLVEGHLHADFNFARKLVRFLENHDEGRAASEFPEWSVHKAAAVISFLTPGMRFFYDGQMEGRKVKVSMHLGRRRNETVNEEISKFYHSLLNIITREEAKTGTWHLLNTNSVWQNNHSFENFVAFVFHKGEKILLVAVNYSDQRGQCFVRFGDFGTRFYSKTFTLKDLLSEECYVRDGNSLADQGLYLDVDPWKAHVFEFI